MEKEEQVKEVSTEEKLIQEAIFEVLENENRAHTSCINPNKEGVFTPLLAVDDHLFNVTIRQNSKTISIEMIDNELLVGGLINRIKKANGNPGTKEKGKKRWMSFRIDKKTRYLTILAEVSVNPKEGKGKVVESIRTKFSFFIVLVSMFYSGVFDMPEDAGKPVKF
ncbi:MAG: hypothetical protein ABSE68_00425 [Minisyncoccia bacterium]